MDHHNIKAERVRIGLTQQALADEVGVTVLTVSNWERGKAEPTATNLVRLSHVFGCSPDYLLDLTDVRN